MKPSAYVLHPKPTQYKAMQWNGDLDAMLLFIFVNYKQPKDMYKFCHLIVHDDKESLIVCFGGVKHWKMNVKSWLVISMDGNQLFCMEDETTKLIFDPVKDKRLLRLGKNEQQL